jgi:hypothetical protein
MEVNMYLQNMSIKRAFSLFLCAAFPPVSFIMSQFPNYMRNVSDVYSSAWVWTLNNSNVNSCFILIRQNLFPVSFSSRIS